MPTTYTGIPTNAQVEAIYKDQLLKNRLPQSALAKRLFGSIERRLLQGDTLTVRNIINASFNFDYPSGVTGQGGSVMLKEYNYLKKPLSMPVSMNTIDYHRLKDPTNAKSAMTMADFYDAAMSRADELVLFDLMGDGSGRIANVSATAIANGVVVLASDTPKIIFDRHACVGNYVCVAVRATGVMAVNPGGSGSYIEGFIVASNFATKTIYLHPAGWDYSVSDAATASADLDFTTTLNTEALYYAKPGKVAISATASAVRWGLEPSATADAATNRPMHGILKLNQVHTLGSHKLYAVDGATTNSFQPMTVTPADTTLGISKADIEDGVQGCNSDFQDFMFLTDQIIRSDYFSRYSIEAGAFRALKDGDPTNMELGFAINGRVYQVEGTPYWNGKGEFHGLDLSTLGMVYTQTESNAAIGDYNPGFTWLLGGNGMKADGQYYGLENQLYLDANFVSNGLRNKNFVIGSCQTSRKLP
jgi:hypothetical protein